MIHKASTVRPYEAGEHPPARRKERIMMSNEQRKTKTGRSHQRVVVLFALFVLSALVARGQTVNVVCLGTTAITYSPGLRTSMQGSAIEVHELDTYAPCISTDPTVTAASDIFVGKLPLSCNLPMFAATADLDVKWSNGKSSTFHFNFTTHISEGQMIILGQGSVRSGLFSGATALVQYTYIHPSDQLCDTTTGVTNASGQTALQIFTQKTRSTTQPSRQPR